MIEAVLLDIEGTTSSIAFVKETLFPYAREQLGRFVAERGGDPQVRALLDDARSEAGAPQASDDDVVALLRRWIDEDRKVTPLKALQGLIWERGYREGDYQAHLYPEVHAHLRGWRERGLPLWVYSSGSVRAQELFFGHTIEGDLCGLFAGYFDTTTGPKKQVSSYERIALSIGLPAEKILFLSDVPAELDAARGAGMRTCWLVREGEPTPGVDHPLARTFDDVDLS